MTARRCTQKIHSVHRRPTVRCSERAVLGWGDLIALCGEHAEKFIHRYPDQQPTKVFKTAVR